DAPRAGESRQKQTFAAEYRGLDSPDELNIVIDRFVERHNASGFNLQGLSRSQGEIKKVAPGVDEDEPWPGELLKNETLPAEEPGAHSFDEGDGELNRRLSKQKRVTLSENTLPRRQIKRLDSPGIAAREADLARSVRPEKGYEQRFAGYSSPQCAE